MQTYPIADLPKLKVNDDRFDVRYINTENLSVAFNIMEPGAVVPVHQHNEETIDIVLDGVLKMTVGAQTLMMTKNTVTKVGSDIPHGATAITRCEVINIFYPARKDFL